LTKRGFGGFFSDAEQLDSAGGGLVELRNLISEKARSGTAIRSRQSVLKDKDE
jgi:hypothetical protein